MRFRVDRNMLADAVVWTARALPTRPAVPILAGMRLEATEQLRLSSFDYEVSAEASLDLVDVEETGSALVSGRLLAEITRSLPAQPVQIATDGAKATLTCGNAKFTLMTLPVEEYPTLPEMPPPSGTIGSDSLATAVSQVAVAASRDDTLPLLTGVLLEIEGDTISLSASDRYRIGARELHWKPEQPDLSLTALIPAKTLVDTARSLASGAEVAIALAEAGGAGASMIGFTGGGRQTTTRLIEGETVKYRSKFPTDFAARAELETAAFVEALRRVALVAERNTPVRLSFASDEVVLEAGSGEEAQAVEVLGTTLEGEPSSIAFNPQFLLDGLTAIGSDNALLHFNSPDKPALLTGKPADDASAPDYRYLVMPIRLHN